MADKALEELRAEALEEEGEELELDDDTPPDGGNGRDEPGGGGDTSQPDRGAYVPPPADQPAGTNGGDKPLTPHEQLKKVRSTKAEHVEGYDKVTEQFANDLAHRHHLLDRIEEDERRLAAHVETFDRRKAKYAGSLARDAAIEPYTAWWQGMEVTVFEVVTIGGETYAKVTETSTLIPFDQLELEEPELPKEPEPTPQPAAPEPEPEEPEVAPPAPEPVAPVSVPVVSPGRSLLERKRRQLRAKRDLLAKSAAGRRRRRDKKFRVDRIL